MNYDVCFDIAAMFILIIAMLNTSNQYVEPTRRNRCFKRVLWSLLLALPMDAAGALTINAADAVSVTLNMTLNALGFICISFVLYSYALYMESLVAADLINKVHRAVNHILFTIYMISHIVNIFVGFYFYFDEDMQYVKASLYYTVYVVPLYFFTYGVVTLVRNYKTVEKRQFWAALSLLPFAAVGTVLQATVLPRYLTILFTVALGVMIIMFNIETPDYKKLQVALKEADTANRSKGDFLANMSHEIRTPMNAIVGMCELILRERDISQQVQEYCYNIQSSGRSLLAIINDILDFSKIESGKMEIIEDEFNISSTLNDVINMAVARKGDKNIEIIVHVDPDLPTLLIGDEIRIRQIIVNIVTNAIKYTKSGCVSIRVSQTKHDYGINLSVSVKDTGIGITEENLEKLFSSFQQVDTKKNRAVEGTGLGLAISKRLITKMGGFISVSSEYGKGSEFRFVVPLRVKNRVPFVHVNEAYKIRAAGYIGLDKFTDPRVSEEYRTLISELGKGLKTRIDLFESMEELKKALANAEERYNYVFTAKEEFVANKDFFMSEAGHAEIVLVQDRSDAVEAPENVRCMYKPFYVLSAASVFNHESIMTNVGERRNAGARFVAPQAKILIVDDNQINLKVAVGLMRPYHMQIFTADGASAAISMLRSKDFHIVFMDHMMPEIDGVEATKMIREMDDEYYKKLPIIALTANAVNGVKEMFIASGMNDFIAKPIELTALDRALKTWLPKELMKQPTESERYINDRRKAPEVKHESDSELLVPATGVFYTGGDEEAYLEILEMYVSKGAEKREYIQKLFDDKSWKNYVIEVHALKSSSLTVGAKELSELAKELELAGKAEKYSVIEEKNAAMLEMYGKVVSAGRDYLEKFRPDSGGEEEASELRETDVETVIELVGRITAACGAFDGDEAAAVCDEAFDLSFKGEPLKPLFAEVKALASDFEYEKAAEKASRIAKKVINS